ncbi:hypothetical protein Q8F55_004721 [Vanrija albida]|uniref:Uncharacterized protein n=1 Tax=Vanrija albida TaxID=181172 RepID=A0ABR3Q086_9TREE
MNRVPIPPTLWVRFDPPSDDCQKVICGRAAQSSCPVKPPAKYEAALLAKHPECANVDTTVIDSQQITGGLIIVQSYDIKCNVTSEACANALASVMGKDTSGYTSVRRGLIPRAGGNYQVSCDPAIAMYAVEGKYWFRPGGQDGKFLPNVSAPDWPCKDERPVCINTTDVASGGNGAAGIPEGLGVVRFAGAKSGSFAAAGGGSAGVFALVVVIGTMLGLLG